MTAESTTTISLVRAVGLSPPAARPRAAWYSWVTADASAAPDGICFVWCPATGRLWAGVGTDHRGLVARRERDTVGIALLGYAFPAACAIAIRGVYRDLTGDTPAPAAAKTIAAFVRILRRRSAEPVTIFSSPDNLFLWARLSDPADACTVRPERSGVVDR
jgi:hypothetical protein